VRGKGYKGSPDDRPGSFQVPIKKLQGGEHLPILPPKGEGKGEGDSSKIASLLTSGSLGSGKTRKKRGGAVTSEKKKKKLRNLLISLKRERGV